MLNGTSSAKSLCRKYHRMAPPQCVLRMEGRLPESEPRRLFPVSDVQ